MAPPQSDPEGSASTAAVDARPVDDARPDVDARPDGDGADVVVRRAPFSDNPRVGARGQRTQQRIIDAAVRVFGDEGYHQCGVARITELAGCSRASFYQYFSGKEDVFRHLAGQVARQLSASTEALGLVTPDAEGWRAIRSWVARYAEVSAYDVLWSDVVLVEQGAITGEAPAVDEGTAEDGSGRLKTAGTKPAAKKAAKAPAARKSAPKKAAKKAADKPAAKKPAARKKKETE